VPIETPQPPDDALEAVRASVARRQPSPRGLGRLRELGRRRAPERADATFSTPHRVFTAGLDELARGDALDSAALPTGWRFLIDEGAEPVAAAEVQDTTRAAAPAQVTEGPFVAETATGLSAARELPTVRDTDFELRFLRVPALHLVAIWLSAPGRDDVLIPLDPAPDPFEAGRAYDAPDFVSAAQSLAQSTLDAHESGERPDDLGG
jgi:hypothetical protein